VQDSPVTFFDGSGIMIPCFILNVDKQNHRDDFSHCATQNKANYVGGGKEEFCKGLVIWQHRVTLLFLPFLKIAEVIRIFWEHR